MAEGVAGYGVTIPLPEPSGDGEPEAEPATSGAPEGAA